MPCITIEQEGRGYVKTATEQYEAIVAAAYAPYEGGTPCSTSDEFTEVLEE